MFDIVTFFNSVCDHKNLIPLTSLLVDNKPTQIYSNVAENGSNKKKQRGDETALKKYQISFFALKKNNSEVFYPG